MLFVDSRAGSDDLIKPLAKALSLDPEDVKTTLPFGDVMFEGRGIGGAALTIGIEFKKLGEMITSCRDGRFAGHQLPGMLKTYERSYLLIEGTWRADRNGFVATFQGSKRGWQAVPGKMRAAEYEKHLLTFGECGAITVTQTDIRESTLRYLVNLYRWWTDSDLDKHTSHLAVHQPAMLGEVSDIRRALMQWPGVGREVSKAAEWTFGSVENAATASAQSWAVLDVNGKQFGQEKARKVVEFLRKRGIA